MLVATALALAAGRLGAAENLSKVPQLDPSTLLSAPRPEYPFEARKLRQTGSGVVLLEVDPATGAVKKARMAQSTGHRVLDEAAIAACSAWRFRKGVPARQKAPITFTMTGMRY